MAVFGPGNWEKSALMPVNPINSLPPSVVQLRVVDRIKCLGIWLTRDPNQYIDDNLVPLLLRFRRVIYGAASPCLWLDE